MTNAPSPEAVLAWSQLVRAEQGLLSKVEEDLKRAGFPPLLWYDVLCELDHASEGWLLQSVVQARVQLAQYNLCRLVDRLEGEGLLVRKPCTSDARSKVLTITDTGRALRAKMWPVYATAIEEHFGARLTQEEASQLAQILAKLVASGKEQ